MADDKLIELEKRADALIEQLGSEMPMEKAVAALNLAGLEVETMAAMKAFAEHMSRAGVERPLMTFGARTFHMQQEVMKDAMNAAKLCPDPEQKAKLLNVVIQSAKLFPELSEEMIALQDKVNKEDKKLDKRKNAPPNVMQVNIVTDKANVHAAKKEIEDFPNDAIDE